LLHHDNAPAHNALSIQQFLVEKNITVIPWPAYSPDLLPIEHLWEQIGWWQQNF
uniref:Tc1-like transposase DDE domain-containing protein n=1 Tax=Stegastes partitus TaxID=144197 RepID=A0A3B5B8R6_9TELE